MNVGREEDRATAKQHRHEDRHRGEVVADGANDDDSQVETVCEDDDTAFKHDIIGILIWFYRHGGRKDDGNNADNTALKLVLQFEGLGQIVQTQQYYSKKNQEFEESVQRAEFLSFLGLNHVESRILAHEQMKEARCAAKVAMIQLLFTKLTFFLSGTFWVQHWPPIDNPTMEELLASWLEIFGRINRHILQVEPMAPDNGRQANFKMLREIVFEHLFPLLKNQIFGHPSMGWVPPDVQTMLGEAGDMLEEARSEEEDFDTETVETIALQFARVLIDFISEHVEGLERNQKDNGNGDEHDQSYAYKLLALGSIYHGEGNLNEAFDLYQQALEIYSEGTDDHENMANVMNNMAVIHLERGNHKDALPLFQRAYDIFSSKVFDDENNPHLVKTRARMETCKEALAGGDE